MMAYTIEFCLGTYIGGLSSLLTSRQYSKLLNSWINLHSKQPHHFPSFLGLSQCINKAAYYVQATTFSVGLWSLFLVSGCFTKSNSMCGYPDYFVSGSLVVLVTIGVFDMAQELLKIYMVTRLLIDSHNYVHKQITKINDVNLIGCLNLLHWLRRQQKLTNRVFGPRLQVFASFFFVSAVMSWIVFFSTLRSIVPLFAACTAIGYQTLQAFIFLWLAKLDESLRNKESQIVVTVAGIMDKHELEKLEVKQLY